MNETTLRVYCCVLIAAALVLLLPATAGADRPDSWTQWGGPGQNFKAPAAEIADSWGEHGPRQLWTRELGDGYSTVLVEDGRLYTMYRAGEEDTPLALVSVSGDCPIRGLAVPTSGTAGG